MAEKSDAEETVGILVSAKVPTTILHQQSFCTQLTLQNTALAPVRLAVSRPARRAYLSTFLLLVTSLALLGLAVFAYIVFYAAYVPVRGFSTPVHLQFDPGKHPYASLDLPSGLLVHDQAYDITATLVMPRTRTNRLAGNFMLDIVLLSPEGGWTEERRVVVKERRAAIMTYKSWLMEGLTVAVRIPCYVLGWGNEAEKLNVDISKGVIFGRGRIPREGKIEVQSSERLQVYDMALVFRTRLNGMRYVSHVTSGAADQHRYLMYNWCITSFFVFTTVFWSVEMFIASVMWFGLSHFLSRGSKSKDKSSHGKIKKEPSPTLTPPEPSMLPLTPVKKEELDELPMDVYPEAVEGDVEDEDGDEPMAIATRHAAGPSDSGIGTSMESSAAKQERARRRSSRSVPDEL